jgi:hypothetical protein
VGLPHEHVRINVHWSILRKRAPRRFRTSIHLICALLSGWAEIVREMGANPPFSARKTMQGKFDPVQILNYLKQAA